MCGQGGGSENPHYLEPKFFLCFIPPLIPGRRLFHHRLFDSGEWVNRSNSYEQHAFVGETKVKLNESFNIGAYANFC